MGEEIGRGLKGRALCYISQMLKWHSGGFGTKHKGLWKGGNEMGRFIIFILHNGLTTGKGTGLF